MKAYQLVVLLGSLTACAEPADDPVASQQAQAQRADQVMYGVKQHISSAGIRRGLLNADTAFVFEDSGRVEIRKVKLEMYNEAGGRAADLTSRAGTLDTRTQGMIARGSVVLQTSDGKRIETEELHYDPNAHRVWSTVKTTMIANGAPLTGDGFSADDQMRNIQVTRPRGRVSGGSGGGLKF
jgi:LPS export ABC transporter protein LptC